VKLIPWLRGPRLGAPRSVGEIVEEIESWAMYLSDLAVSDPERVAPYRDKIRQIGELLSKIATG
jgi:hypothetical protein